MAKKKLILTLTLTSRKRSTDADVALHAYHQYESHRYASTQMVERMQNFAHNQTVYPPVGPNVTNGRCELDKG